MCVSVREGGGDFVPPVKFILRHQLLDLSLGSGLWQTFIKQEQHFIGNDYSFSSLPYQRNHCPSFNSFTQNDIITNKDIIFP